MSMPSENKESDIQIALRLCPKSRAFRNEEVLILATAQQFDQLVKELVAKHANRLLKSLDAMDRGCRQPGFRGHENGYGESVGDELQDAREELASMVGHVAAIEIEEPEVAFVEMPMPQTQL